VLGGVLPLRYGDGDRLLLERERGVKDRLRRGSLALKGTVAGLALMGVGAGQLSIFFAHTFKSKT